VGDERTVELLRDFGVNFAQGFHLGHPRPIEEMAWTDAGEPLRPASR